MAFYAGQLVRRTELENPTIVVITDRNDLDDQLFGTFSMCRDLVRQTPIQADSREDLQSALSRASGGVIFTTIQKFSPAHGETVYPRLWTPEQGMRRKRFRDNPIQAMRVKKGGKGRPATRRFLTRRKSRKRRPSIDGAAGPSSRRVVREGKVMIHSSRRDRKAKAIAEVLAMIANAQAPLAPHRPRPVLEADERLFETAAEFCAALEKYAECATQIKRVNH
jgi:SWI2/SNF2 ATPase